MARVEPLMALCNDLGARLCEERAAAERLSAGLCRAAAGSPPDGDAALAREPAEDDSEEQPEAPEAPAPPPAAARARAIQAGGESAAGDAYQVAVALLAKRGALTNGDLQTALGLDATTARALLKGWWSRAWPARQEGERRGGRYIGQVQCQRAPARCALTSWKRRRRSSCAPGHHHRQIGAIHELYPTPPR